jgi:hypothetical protein
VVLKALRLFSTCPQNTEVIPMAPSSRSAGKVHPAVAAIEKSGAPKVKVAVSDIDGILRGKYLHRDKFLGAAEPFRAAASASATWCWAGT